MAPETLTATQAAALFRPVDSFAVGLGPANPQALLVALSERDDFEDLTLGGALILGLYDLMGKPGVHYRCGFFGPAERFYKAAGADIQLVPAGFRQFAPVLEEYAPRIMAVQATPPDAEGTCSLSLHYGATRRELLRAGHDPNRLLIVEVNPNLPRTSALEGFDNTISTDIIDVIVECDLPPVVLPDSNPAPQDEAIAEFALSLIPDRATLQTGIGGIPSIVAAKLAQREGGGYGVHSEMFTDGLMQLHLAGKVTNEHKGQFPGVSVTTFALGSAELYAWLDRNPQVAFAPVSLVNDPSVIAKNDRFISINGAITVDLFGQVVADSVEGRQISGVGGHEDFVAGAEFRLEDRSLICLHSTIEVDGEVRSRIVAGLPFGSVVSTPRHHTGTIITEFGSVELRGLTVRERAFKLASIAHPDFRDDLVAAADRLDR
jgi:acyl-CoA hydrolase